MAPSNTLCSPLPLDRSLFYLCAMPSSINFAQLKVYLDEKAEHYNQPDFIVDDPICIPHQFSQQQDIEIAGLFAAILAWGQRKTIINKCQELMARMGHSPYQFVRHHSEGDLRSLKGFVHRTFNDTDLLYFIRFLSRFYQKHDSLEEAFLWPNHRSAAHIGEGLNQFSARFFDDEFAPSRTQKHIASPNRHSACKRLNMYLRWMVRTDDKGVDFGIWNQISPSQLVCPCDVHVERIARQLGLITRKQMDWRTALELTESLRILDASDPVKYDFALFGIGVSEKIK